MKMMFLVSLAFVFFEIGLATHEPAARNDQMQLAACVYARNEVLESGTLLCDPDCGGRDITTLVKSSKNCPSSIDL
jgi:hypothetical protein